MTQMREAIIFVVGFILLAAAPAQAATIEAKPKSNIIEIKGNIETGDFNKFSALIGRFPETKIVSLSSNGGRMLDAFRIGILLRIFEMGTVVPAGQRCGSACVFIWASGITRELGPGANLFMHCTFKEKTPKICADQALNVRYLTSTGMPQEAINILTTSKPSDKILVRRTMDGLVKPREKTAGKSI